MAPQRARGGEPGAAASGFHADKHGVIGGSAVEWHRRGAGARAAGVDEPGREREAADRAASAACRREPDARGGQPWHHARRPAEDDEALRSDVVQNGAGGQPESDVVSPASTRASP